jgi:Gas vesicle synthesis protein GvpL/GvpF
MESFATAEDTAPTALSPGCLYIYGIVDRLIHPGLLVGATRGAELHITGAGRVAAVHSAIDPDELAELEPELGEGTRLAELVRRHDEVVMALALGGAVLPVRLGTLLPDRSALSRLLEDGHDMIAEALDRVRGRGEWQLRITCSAAEDEPAGPIPAAPSGSGAGTAYLLARREERRRVDQHRERVLAAIDALDDSLSFFADDAAGPGFTGSGLSVSRTYLVSHLLQESFIAAGEDGIAALLKFGCEAKLRGPLPAYSFADIRLGSLTR